MNAQETRRGDDRDLAFIVSIMENLQDIHRSAKTWLEGINPESCAVAMQIADRVMSAKPGDVFHDEHATFIAVGRAFAAWNTPGPKTYVPVATLWDDGAHDSGTYVKNLVLLMPGPHPKDAEAFA